MKESEIIIVDTIPNEVYDSILEKCVMYAIISLPFTVDRMAIPDEKQRALNIAKGKIAEELFKFFCQANKIYPDFDSCATDFWTVDNRDFILNSKEWDIKNNFIYTERDILDQNYTDLPALIPNRFNGDQWTKKNQNLISGSNGVQYLFTFLKNATLNNGKREQDFLEVKLSDGQHKLLRDLYLHYKGELQNKQPFTQERFWNEMAKHGDLNFFKLHSRPYLVITGYANDTHWHLFKDTGPFDRNNNWQTYLQPRWYTKTSKGSCNFMNGTLWTTINNSTIPISSLTSFYSLFPDLKFNIQFARLRQI